MAHRQGGELLAPAVGERTGVCNPPRATRSGPGQARRYRPRLPTARFYFNCRHHPALPRTAAVGQEETLGGPRLVIAVVTITPGSTIGEFQETSELKQRNVSRFLHLAIEHAGEAGH
jgi:hypothetical protein